MTLMAAMAVLGGLFGLLALGLVAAERVLVNYGTCRLRINGGERDLEVEGGQSLLSALYGARIFIPSACGGRGSCSYCKVIVLEGGGPVLPTETPYLSRREIKAGLRLACQVKVRRDLEVRIPEELLDVRLFRSTVAHTRDLTHDIKEVRLALVDPPEIEHLPGQYVQVQAPSPGGAVFRAYSIASPVHERSHVDLVVRLVPGGIGSTYIHDLQAGDEVLFTGPFGEFRLDEDPQVEVVCVAGGCGMAPVRNIIYSIYRRWPDRRAWLFFGCRTTRDIFYLDDYRDLAREHPAFRVVYALSDPLGPEEEWNGETGFIHLAVDKYLDSNPRRQAFLCGPPPMIEAVMRVLEDKGLPPGRIFYDKF